MRRLRGCGRHRMARAAGRRMTFLSFRKGAGTLHCTPRAPVAQLDRALGFEPVKFWFESSEFCFWISDLLSER